MRLRSDFFVSALLRRCAIANLDAVLVRRGAAEAGAIFIQVDDLAGGIQLYGPSSQSEVAQGERGFTLLHKASEITAGEAATLISRQVKFDSDLWLIEVEDRSGVAFTALLADT